MKVLALVVSLIWRRSKRCVWITCPTAPRIGIRKFSAKSLSSSIHPSHRQRHRLAAPTRQDPTHPRQRTLQVSVIVTLWIRMIPNDLCYPRWHGRVDSHFRSPTSTPVTIRRSERSAKQIRKWNTFTLFEFNSLHYFLFQAKREPSKEDLEKTLATLSEMSANDFVCDGTYPSLEESLESFNTDDVSNVNTNDDAQGPIYNYEWVHEVMQALNVSPDVSNAFHVSLKSFSSIRFA